MGTATGTRGAGGLAMYTVADAEFAMVLEDGRLVVWLKGVRYDAARLSRGLNFEGQGGPTPLAGGEAGDGDASWSRGGMASEWREVVAQGKWSLIAVTMEASADYGPAGLPRSASKAPADAGLNPLPPPAGAVVGDGHVIGAEEKRASALGASSAAAGAGQTSSGLRMSMYVDGRLQLGFTPVPELDEDASPLLVGGCNCTKTRSDGVESPTAWPDAAHEPFEGWMDSVRVWTRALVEEEVIRLARSAPADSDAPSPHLELPFPVQVLDVPSAPEGIQVVAPFSSLALTGLKSASPMEDSGGGEQGVIPCEHCVEVSLIQDPHRPCASGTSVASLCSSLW